MTKVENLNVADVVRSVVSEFSPVDLVRLDGLGDDFFLDGNGFGLELESGACVTFLVPGGVSNGQLGLVVDSDDGTASVLVGCQPSLVLDELRSILGDIVPEYPEPGECIDFLTPPFDGQQDVSGVSMRVVMGLRAKCQVSSVGNLVPQSDGSKAFSVAFDDGSSACVWFPEGHSRLAVVSVFFEHESVSGQVVTDLFTDPAVGIVAEVLGALGGLERGVA